MTKRSIKSMQLIFNKPIYTIALKKAKRVNTKSLIYKIINRFTFEKYFFVETNISLQQIELQTLIIHSYLLVKTQ